ncbi:MAG: VanZ family protein [Desulfobacula sp.]|nr:VanZ family protein [Desulfobacula sp.]
MNLFKLTFCFAILAFVTLFCHTFVDRYEKNGAEMLTNNWQSSVSEDGTAKISKNELYLSSKNSAHSAQFQQDIPDFKPGDILMLSADMKYTDIVPGEQPWNLARLLLVQNDGTKNRWDYPHGVASFTGTQDWKRYNNVFTLNEDTKHLRVTAQMSRCTGSFQLKDLQLYPVKQTMVYTWIQLVILFCWAMFAVFLLGTCFGNGSMVILKVLLVISFVAIIIGTTMPQEMRNQVSQEVSIQLQETSDVFQRGATMDIAKLGHFGFFALFGVLLSLLMKQEPLVGVVFHILLLAGGTELAQFFIDGRSPLFADFFIDLAGGGCGVVFSLLILKKKINLAVRFKTP